MTNYFTSKASRSSWLGRLCFALLLVLATLYFTNAQPCPTTPSPGNETFPIDDGNTTHLYPSALPAGVTTGNPNATHGSLYHDGNKGTATPLTTVTIHPQWSDGTMGWAVINLYYLEIASSGAVIKIYNGEGTSTIPVATITSANASTYYRFNHKNNGPITVTMENTATAATGNFDVEVAYMSGEVVATSPFGQEFTYWKHFITPNSRAYIDSRAGSTSTIATGYFDANKNLISSELSWCIDYGQSAPRRGNIYPGEMVFYPTARPDINEDGAVTTEDKLKTARLIYILQNAPTPISDHSNFDAVRSAVDAITTGNGNPPLAAAAIAAIPSLPSPEEPVFSITGPATPVLTGTAQNFVINLTDDGGHPRVYKLRLPAGVTLNSVTGAGVTYNSANQTITFASSPGSATVNVTSLTSQTATVGIVYEQTGFWNVNNLVIYEPCDYYNVTDNDYQGFLGLSKVENPYPFREATGSWLPQPAFPCSELSYVIGNRNIGGANVSDGYTLDLSSGVTTLGKQTLIEGPNAFINAIGYNIVDNYIWGFRYGTNQLVRIGSDWSVTFHNVTGFPSPVPGYATGDVSPDGILYLYEATSNQITKVDLNPGSANYLTAVTLPTSPTELNDWSFNPTNGLLYGFGTNKVLYQFDPTTGNRTTLGAVTGAGIETSGYTGAFGTAFFDTDGDMYVGNNGTGAIFKISTPLTNLTASLFSTASGVTPGDGARCPSAIVTDPPVAVDDNGSATCNAATVDVLANDIAGSAPLVPSSVKLLTPGSLNRVTTLTVAEQGQYNVDPSSGAVTFTPVNGLTGTVSIDYVVTDGNGLESIATLTIIVDCPLPVTLVAFDARKEGNSAHLTWSTTEETNSDRFEIQRSANGKVWVTIGSVLSNGESNIIRKYTYTDDSPEKGENLYRLKMVDLDGTYAFSRIRTVSVENGIGQISVYPNPVQNELTIQGLLGAETISILDVSGRLRAESRNKAGQNKHTIDIRLLAEGIYVISVQMADGSCVSQKIIKSK